MTPYFAEDKTHFQVRSPRARALWLCLFDGESEQRHAMVRHGEDWVLALPGNRAGARYGYRAEGEWAPERGDWFDSAKLLVDPYAVELDRRFVQDPRLARHGAETARLVPRAIVPAALPDMPAAPPFLARGGLVYEVNVRAFSLLHPEVPADRRGTIAALAHPAVIAHLRKLGVSAVELMPVVASIDERHLPPLGLRNTWGYNPVAPMALDPGLCPGGLAELRDTVAALHAASIGVILDLVFNHTGESDVHGGILSLRGLDDAAYARAPDGSLINDTGCGNTLDFANPHVRALALATMRHFVRRCGVDGFRFDLATILARGPGFDPAAPIFAEIAGDPALADRVLIAEPWDIGPGGYQLGSFPAAWLEWNDRYRDDVRRFWRGDGGIGNLADRMAGSSDLFGDDCRSVNFLAAHDGFTLADTVAYAARHNLANGEDNRDGHASEVSWNNGIEGPTADAAVLSRRAADLRAMLGTLFASTGTIMLTAGDEFGRSQQGNNNAYCQDMPLDWINRDRDLEAYVSHLSAQRSARAAGLRHFPGDGKWRALNGEAMTAEVWEAPASHGFAYEPADPRTQMPFRVDREARSVQIGDYRAK